MDPYARPWEDVPETFAKAQRTTRRVEMLSRVRLDGGRVTAVGSVQSLRHPFALRLVRAKRAEPVL